MTAPTAAEAAGAAGETGLGDVGTGAATEPPGAALVPAARDATERIAPSLMFPNAGTGAAAGAGPETAVGAAALLCRGATALSARGRREPQDRQYVWFGSFEAPQVRHAMTEGTAAGGSTRRGTNCSCATARGAMSSIGATGLGAGAAATGAACCPTGWLEG